VNFNTHLYKCLKGQSGDQTLKVGKKEFVNSMIFCDDAMNFNKQWLERRLKVGKKEFDDFWR
jgi:hypothetical protein